jgi:hypothetical protein
VNSPKDEARGDDILLTEGEEFARGGHEREEPPIDPGDRLEGRRELELEPGGGLHAHRPAELGDDGELALADRKEAQRGEPDENRAEADEGQEQSLTPRVKPSMTDTPTSGTKSDDEEGS